MNTRSFLVCFIVVMLATSMATAGTHQGSFAPAGSHFVRGGTGVSNGGHWNGGNWNGGNGGGNWHHHHHDNFSNFVFVGGFGFPFFGYPYGYGYSPYSYGYAPYGYGYGSGYYGYGNGYYGGGGYGNSYYGNGYYGNRSYGNGVYRSSYYSGYRSNGSRSGVARLQRQLSRAGYYRGPIDGVMGSRTHYALRAYQHDHGTASFARD
jgi:hypothetical protein